MAVPGTTIHVPIPRRELVPRPRLTTRLRPGEHRLVLVAAPAGFGKTTMLSQWLARDPAHDAGSLVVWLSLDASHNDPRRFLEHLLAALQSRGGGYAEAAGLLAAAGEVSPEAVLTSVVNELDLEPGPVVVVLDDYHVIETPEVHQGVAYLLDTLPPRATLVVATRADPPLPLSRLRAGGELVEIRAADLRFTADEAQTFLSGVMGLDLSPGQVAALEARTEGWAAGLQLAGLSLQGSDDREQFVEAFRGSHRFVLDYLVDEVLHHQPSPTRDFLLDTAVLDQLSGPLCNAVTGRDDGAATLESLERSNLFVIALDEQRTWYRYHHLFGDALRARLGAERPDRVPALHRAASQWYAAQGQLEDAVAHALLAQDSEYAAGLVEQALPGLRRDRRDRVLHRWLDALPAEVVAASPLLGTFLGWSRLVAGDLAGLEAALGEAERALEAAPPRSGPVSTEVQEELRTLPATMALFRASAAQARGDTEATRRHAREALARATDTDHLARSGALGFLGLVAWAQGDLVEATDTFTEAMASLGRGGNVTDQLGGTVVLGSLWVARGRPDRARELFETALATAARHPAGLATAGDLHVGLAELLIEHQDLPAAQDRLRAAQALGESASLLENRHRWYAASARLRRAMGDLEGAVGLLDQAETHYLPGFFPDVRPIAAQRARVRIAQGRLEDAREWARAHVVRQEGPASYRAEFDQLTHVRLLLAEVRAGGDPHRLDEARAQLGLVAQGAVEGGRGGSVIELTMLQALVDDAQGDRSVALSHLGDALGAAVPVGYARLFLDEGPAIDTLLAAAESLPAVGHHARGLRRAAYPPTLPTHEPDHGLSERELEVLRLLATPLTGPEIARQLYVSVNTLRTHTKHIFTKLEVNTRRAAVDRATGLGLL